MSERKQDRVWPWYVRAYYTKDVEPPKQPGGLAFESKHKNEITRDYDAAEAKKRPDIARVETGPRFR